jgi:hypothetical protein
MKLKQRIQDDLSIKLRVAIKDGRGGNGTKTVRTLSAAWHGLQLVRKYEL